MTKTVLLARGEDPFPVLCQEAERSAAGEVMCLRWDASGSGKLARGDVARLATIAGFAVGGAYRVEGGWEMELVRERRPQPGLSCSVIVPCRNEVGNVDALVRRVPPLGAHTELLFVDGHSSDGTPERITELIAAHPERDITLLCQSGGGKATAVFQGFDAAQGDIVMILDADMTVAPEDLPRFYLALTGGLADFANGNRFAFPQESGSMPGVNRLGNHGFALLLSGILGVRIADSLCGTKAFFRRDWPRLRETRALFGNHDPWGDFDLLLAAAYEGLRIRDVPVPYGARTAGESKMRPLEHGAVLGRTCATGWWRLRRKGRPTRARGNEVRETSRS